MAEKNSIDPSVLKLIEKLQDLGEEGISKLLDSHRSSTKVLRDSLKELIMEFDNSVESFVQSDSKIIAQRIANKKIEVVLQKHLLEINRSLKTTSDIYGKISKQSRSYLDDKKREVAAGETGRQFIQFSAKSLWVQHFLDQSQVMDTGMDKRSMPFRNGVPVRCRPPAPAQGLWQAAWASGRRGPGRCEGSPASCRPIPWLSHSGGGCLRSMPRAMQRAQHQPGAEQ